MPFTSQRAKPHVSSELKAELTALSTARTAPAHRVERARILLAFDAGQSVSTIARELRITRPKVERCLNKAVQLGIGAALADLPGRGRPARLTPEARAWVVDLACQQPKHLGYSYELWTTDLLARHVRTHGAAAGHACLAKLSRGTVSKILRKSGVQPHKIRYYLERRDPEFAAKMTQVLYVYQEVALLRDAGSTDPSMLAVLSYDEKPGIQAIATTAPDLPPLPGVHPSLGRDHEYVRHGTLTLMAGIDLLTGFVHGIVTERHRSQEFTQFLAQLHAYYPAQATIRLVLDNHSAHISKETRAYLGTLPNRFDFVFTPKHGSWLNLIEAFFGKMAKSMLRGIRVESKAELKRRLELYLAEINAIPVIYRWSYGLDSLAIA